MSDKFTIVKVADKKKSENRTDRIEKLCEIWERQYHNTVLQAMTKNKGMKIADYPQGDLMKIALCGIKYICAYRDVKRKSDKLGTVCQQSLEESQIEFQLIDAIFTVCGYLTLRNFVTTFPVDKYYKGAKWEEKDYFYTMDSLSKMEWDKPIGRDELSELLWDYMNADLRHAYIEFTSAMSAIYRAQTGKGIAEKWCEDLGIPTYTFDKETGIIKDNKTGNISKTKNTSHIQIVE